MSADNWREFLAASHTLATTQREYPDWHQGRERFCVWGLLPNHAQLDQTLQQYRQQLAPWLVMPYPRQAHITLTACGFWQAETHEDTGLSHTDNPPDNYSPQDFRRHCQALEAINLAPFSLQIGALDSFSSALYLRVDDASEHLTRLRAPLQTLFEDIREQPYVPHVTVGVYNASYPTADVAAVITAANQTPANQPLDILVDRVALLSYDTRDIGSHLQVEYEIPLLG